MMARTLSILMINYIFYETIDALIRDVLIQRIHNLNKWMHTMNTYTRIYVYVMITTISDAFGIQNHLSTAEKINPFECVR